MRTPARTKGMRSQVSSPTSLPAPIGGWNARDSLAAMSATDAVILRNWYPATTECIRRSGYSEHATGFPGEVETIFVYSGGSSVQLFGVSSGEIYDATSAGAVGSALVTGLSNSQFQYVNFSTGGGTFLLAVNGIDKLRYYDGSTWSYDGGAHTITGVDTTDCTNITVHKNRIWFTEENTLKLWYLPVNSIAGAAAAFDLASVAQLGGYVVSIATWTIDAGSGIDDYFVAVTSRGEVIVYQGTDPSSLTTWALKGVWRIGAPVGKRCLYKFAGDLLIISQDGVFPLSGALQSSRVNPKVALTDKIQYAVSNAVSVYGDLYGWQLIYCAKINQLWLNVPANVSTGKEQYAMNTISKSWCNYSGWDANCWEIYRDDPYFGGNTFIGKAWDTYSDNGETIEALGLQAFSPFGSPGYKKRFTLVRPVFRASGAPEVQASINIDFDTADMTSPLSFSPTSYGLWDYATWDNSLWAGDVQIIQSWQGVSGVGYYGAPQVKTSSSNIDVRWVSSDIVMERGGVI